MEGRLGLGRGRGLVHGRGVPGREGTALPPWALVGRGPPPLFLVQRPLTGRPRLQGEDPPCNAAIITIISGFFIIAIVFQEPDPSSSWPKEQRDCDQWRRLPSSLHLLVPTTGIISIVYADHDPVF